MGSPRSPEEIFGSNWLRNSLLHQSKQGRRSWLAQVASLQDEGQYFLAICLEGTENFIRYSLGLSLAQSLPQRYLCERFALAIKGRMQDFRIEVIGCLGYLYPSEEVKFYSAGELSCLSDGLLISVTDRAEASRAATSLIDFFKAKQQLYRRSLVWRDRALIGMGKTAVEALQALAAADIDRPVRDFSDI